METTQLNLLDETPDDLFALTTHVCADCGQSFATSRGAKRCATCASLRTGAVGAATVVCPACQVEHQIPILAPTKLCQACRADPVMTRMTLESNLAYAQCHADEAWLKLDATLAHADPTDYARYDAACEKAAAWPSDRWQRARDAAIAKGDGLSPLLAARLAWDDAATALDQVRAEVVQGLAEIAIYQEV